MRKWINFLMTLLVGASASYANANMGEVNFEAGYRQDSLSLRHSVPSDDPFFKTSTRFNDLDIFQIGVNARGVLSCNFYARASANWGWILDGKFKQSVSTFTSTGLGPFFETGSVVDGFGITARTQDAIDDKYVYDANIAIGYPFYFCGCSMYIAPVVGYAVDAQTLEVNNDPIFVEFVNGAAIPLSGSDCCEHTFTNKWYGPFIGFDFDYRPCNECWGLYASIEYHWAHFKAKHDEDFGFGSSGHISRHSNDGHGWVFVIGAEYEMCNCWTIGVDAKVQDFSATRHHRIDGGSFISESFRAKENFKWNSYAVNLTLGRDF